MVKECRLAGIKPPERHAKVAMLGKGQRAVVMIDPLDGAMKLDRLTVLTDNADRYTAGTLQDSDDLIVADVGGAETKSPEGDVHYFALSGDGSQFIVVDMGAGIESHRNAAVQTPF